MRNAWHVTPQLPCTLQAQQELQDVTFDKDDAIAAVQKLRSVIEVVQADVADAQQAADR